MEFTEKDLFSNNYVIYSMKHKTCLYFPLLATAIHSRVATVDSHILN
jgi:hypothetical protein